MKRATRQTKVMDNGQTISFALRVPKGLMALIEKRAEMERRSLGNMLCVLAEEGLMRREGK